jgi:hypothetical protein
MALRYAATVAGSLDSQSVTKSNALGAANMHLAFIYFYNYYGFSGMRRELQLARLTR